MSSGGPYEIGQSFGPYTLDAYLGSGGFKSVYRARRTDGGSPGPVAALGFPHQQDPEGLAELEKEFEVTRRLVHPNILRVFTLERHRNVSFLVMEFLEGMTLRERLRKTARLEQPEAIRYAGLTAEALAYAHSAHVFHRDVKPENMFITNTNELKLLDFGIARMLARTSAKASTRIGTMEYMAPETLQGASGTNADLWALGVTLYEMLAGRRPFSGEVGELIQQIMSGRYDEHPLMEKRVDTRIVRVLRKMLNKDPERRYQTADELVRDLESVARRTRLVDDDESRLEVLIRASFPLIYVVSFEEDRVLDSVRRIARRLEEDFGPRQAGAGANDKRKTRPLLVWSASRGLRDPEGRLIGGETTDDPTAALARVIEDPSDAIYVFLDIHRHFTPVTTRLIRDVARAVRMTRKSVLFVSPSYAAPEELEKEVTLSVFQLPDRQELERVLENFCEELSLEGQAVQLSDEQRGLLARAALGLTHGEADRAFRAAHARRGSFAPGAERDVIEEKTQIVRKSGILEYYHTSESFVDLGGLKRLLAWFNERLPVFANAARYAGLPQPKGVLLVGAPGCGKSLSARALAGAWGVPLLRLDVGRVFGSFVGQSEANLRRAIQTAEAVSPCILWIDEVEKGFAGTQSQGDGGVTARVFGTFLSWLQDKQSPVFVVATANDLSGIPPEFLRKGRFDEIFYVGLPRELERSEIFNIHLRKRGRDPKGFDLMKLAQATPGFSGAEIQEVVVAGLFRAFDEGHDLHPNDLEVAIGETFPLSRSQPDKIQAIAQWAAQNARKAG